MANKSSADLVDAAAAVKETRRDLAARLRGMGAANRSGAAEILSCMDDAPDDFVPSDDFIAGLRFAAELVADPDFDL